MLSNTLIVSEFVETLYSFPTWSCVKMCHTVPRPVPRTWQCVIWYHDQCIAHGNVSYGTTTNAAHLAMCHMVPRPIPRTWQCVIRFHDQWHLAMGHAVPQPVPFTWQCVMRYHDQCNQTLCHTVPQPVYFTWQCVMRNHNQCISPGNVSYGTTTSAFHLAMCHVVPRPVQPSNMSYGITTGVFHLAMCHRYHNQCISHGNVLCDTTTNVFHLAMCYAVPRPVYFTWQCIYKTKRDNNLFN
jgi:hypothetical protein